MRDIVADTVSKVIHKGRSKVSRGPCLEEPPLGKNFAAEQKEVVNNLPSGQDGGERHAPKPARSTVAIPSRVICRRPAGSRASVRRSPENFIPRGSLYQLDR